MNQLFASLSTILNTSSVLALFVSFFWGILSVVLSPCHLATIPLVVGYIAEQSEESTKRAFQISFLFALGMLFSISSIGVVTASFGRILGDLGFFGKYFMATLFIIIGLQFMEVIVFDWNQPTLKNKKTKHSGIYSFLLGALFGIGLGSCTFAYMAPMLGIVFQKASTNLLYSILLILLFAVGHSFVIVLAGTFSKLVYQYLHWSQNSKSISVFRKVCGILLLANGLYYLFFK